MKRTQVLIAGGGPVGMTLAHDLARRGVTCMLVERNLTTTRHPKMDITNARSMELFRHSPRFGGPTPKARQERRLHRLLAAAPGTLSCLTRARGFLLRIASGAIGADALRPALLQRQINHGLDSVRAKPRELCNAPVRSQISA